VKRRTTEITIELESHLEMKWSVTSSMSHCGQCQKVVTVVSPHEDIGGRRNCKDRGAYTEITIELESHLEMKWSVTSSMSHCREA
jgi:hypothetical protein